MLTIEQKGLEQAMNMLKTINRLGNAVKSLELRAKDRIESKAPNNAKIMQQLIRDERDFFSPNDELIAEMDKAMVFAMEQELIKQTKIVAAGHKSMKQAATVVASKGFIEASEVWRRTIVKRIEGGRTAQGTVPKELSEKYKKWKLKIVNFTHPIGKLTGQLLDNMAPGRRNIKLRK